IQTDRIDALNLFDTMHAILENTGFKIRRLAFPEKYYDLFENGFAAHVDTLRDKREALIGFGRAIAKATVGCYANLEACVRISWKQDPALKPKEGSDEDNMQNAVNVLKTRGKSYWAFEKEPHEPWGTFTDEMWRNRIEILHETGVINTDEIDPKDLYTNELLAGINDFDAEAVEREARALK
ncbi:MAG: ABC transporter substrate-binding protein, partial [Vicinamibacteria bacterium]